MTGFTLKKPRLPSHYYLRFEPPGSSADEGLIIRSERRTIVVKGHSFREFLNHVVPLLDGEHTIEDIRERVADIFDAPDLDAALEVLASQGVLEEAAGTDAGLPGNLEFEWNFFHELGLDPKQLRDRLDASTVAVFGLGPLGAVTATTLAAAGVGAIRCCDHLTIAAHDPLLNPLIQPSEVGCLRSEVVRNKISTLNSHTRVSIFTELPETDEAVAKIIDGVDFAVCCADPALSNLFYRLNRACLKASVRWTSGSASGFEGIVGPTVVPGETACYLCYQMRAVACADNPEEQFAHLRFLDRRKQDDSARRENLVFGTGVVGHLLGLEAFRALAGIGPAGIGGRVLIFNFLEMTSQKHVVLRKPWCPACGAVS